MIITRVWAMPSGDTFSIKPIRELLDRWLPKEGAIVDPFARNSKRGNLTNDLSPDTSAQYHMDAVDFCLMLANSGAEADAVLFDPPYSPRQISELYKGIGRPCGMKDTQSAVLYAACMGPLTKILKPGGLALRFGWTSQGFGLKRGFKMEEILLVPHGGAHNDTICTVERKVS